MRSPGGDPKILAGCHLDTTLNWQSLVPVSMLGRFPALSYQAINQPSWGARICLRGMPFHSYLPLLCNFVVTQQQQPFCSMCSNLILRILFLFQAVIVDKKSVQMVVPASNVHQVISVVVHPATVANTAKMVKSFIFILEFDTDMYNLYVAYKLRRFVQLPGMSESSCSIYYEMG